MPGPAVNLDLALLDPPAVFSGPEEVVAHHGLTTEQKREILQRWEYGAIELAVATDEGMTGPENGLLTRILAALHQLDAGVAPGGGPAKNWNVVVTVFEQGYRPALRALRQLGRIARSPYHNVLLMSVDDPLVLLDTLEQRADAEPVLIDSLSRVAPACVCFDFSALTDFEEKATTATAKWLPRLAGSSFHVRLHHRGSGRSLDSPTEERLIAETLLNSLAAAGMPGRISFQDPDAIIAIDTVDDRAGIGFWTRSDLRRYRFLRPD
jgi:hypothetical protein